MNLPSNNPLVFVNGEETPDGNDTEGLFSLSFSFFLSKKSIKKIKKDFWLTLVYTYIQGPKILCCDGNFIYKEKRMLYDIHKT